ncbi:insulinase family protein [Aquimarina sp. ERC-38]|uniref:M16 family metallopeptidase n=1 Tax=Aquimarina sp. ERC-38 TaxID=2949996 RepID=UPI002245A602|nr:pitrilysin family protein [Aquimarina sp. ERC-38]UZO79934.1 insulinase family protein [Aquimarina sp. ERC-38]
MKNYLKYMAMMIAIMPLMNLAAQEVEFTEYDLDNGLHVILHQENKAPVVTVGVMYHVGAKDEDPGRTGFAHFFEHLLFEGTKNIGRGKWFEIVTSKGGSNNANTTQDRTFYYETFPSNNLEVGLWMESERMMHPVINQIGVDTQNEVVKEERRQRYDNAPYGKALLTASRELYKKHPYKYPVIGLMKDLDAAKLEEFQAFNDKFNNPNNATLVVAGDIDIEKTKKMIADYFGPIKNNGKKIEKNEIKEEPITQEIIAKETDANIQVPAKLLVYRTPKQTDKDAYVIDYISTLLTGGKSSRLYKKMVEDKKMSLQVFAFPISSEDYGTYLIGALPLGGVTLPDLQKEIDEEIDKLKEGLISEREFQKLQNQFENDFVNSNATVQGIANSLARYHVLYDNTNLINKEIDIYRSITREDIQRVAKKYLNKNQRVNIDYVPEATN